jgi:hypothetical protein
VETGSAKPVLLPTENNKEGSASIPETKVNAVQPPVIINMLSYDTFNNKIIT